MKTALGICIAVLAVLTVVLIIAVIVGILDDKKRVK